MAYDPTNPDQYADVGNRRGKCSRRRFADLLDHPPEPSNRTRHCRGEEAGNAGKYTGSQDSNDSRASGSAYVPRDPSANRGTKPMPRSLSARRNQHYSMKQSPKTTPHQRRH